MIAKNKKAFTMVELIFVIVILGIVASIGSQIIADVYESYIIQRAQHRASLKTEIVANQIANRLVRAISGTVVRRVDLNGTIKNINEIATDNPNVLQWVGADIDSFTAISGTTASARKPGWSGFCDVDNWATNDTNISTPGSNLDLANTIIENLGGDIANAILFFPDSPYPSEHNVSSGSNETITLDSAPAKIVEHYKLAWSSYALEAKSDGDLLLHYNFAPSRGTQIKDQNTSILLRNVSTFEFKGDGRTIRFKLCVDENIGTDNNVTICKEKAVF